jgi:hypothetical protein
MEVITQGRLLAKEKNSNYSNYSNYKTPPNPAQIIEEQFRVDAKNISVKITQKS